MLVKLTELFLCNFLSPNKYSIYQTAIYFLFPLPPTNQPILLWAPAAKCEITKFNQTFVIIIWSFSSTSIICCKERPNWWETVFVVLLLHIITKIILLRQSDSLPLKDRSLCVLMICEGINYWFPIPSVVQLRTHWPRVSPASDSTPSSHSAGVSQTFLQGPLRFRTF